MAKASHMFFQFVDPQIIGNFSQNSQELGLAQAAQHTLQQLGISVNFQGELTQTGPQLIISNHPSPMDGLVVLSLIARPDVYVIAADVNRAFGPTFAEHMLPVFLSNQPMEHILDWFRIPIATQMEGNLLRTEAIKRNRTTISQATRLVNEGASVVIFPEGRTPTINAAWRKGVSFLLHGLIQPDTTITMINIQNVQWSDTLRSTILGRFSRQLRPTTFTVNSFELVLSDLPRHLEPKALAGEIESIYRQRWLDQV